MKTVAVEVITPQKPVLKGDYEFVVARSLEGELGILPGHTHLLAQLVPGTLRLIKGGVSVEYEVGAGFLDVHPDSITVYALHLKLVQK